MNLSAYSSHVNDPLLQSINSHKFGKNKQTLVCPRSDIFDWQLTALILLKFIS